MQTTTRLFSLCLLILGFYSCQPALEKKQPVDWVNPLGTWPLVFLYPSRTPHGNGQTCPNHECLRKLWELATLWI